MLIEASESGRGGMSGHWGHPHLLADGLADVSDVAEEVEKAQGGFPDIFEVNACVGRRWLAVGERPYVEAARASGCSHCRIMFQHMARNVIAPYLIILTAYVVQAILLEASLSFLGLGVSEPTPAWGLMHSGRSADFYRDAPWMIVFPGLAILISVFAFNLFGDCLRDWLDLSFRI